MINICWRFTSMLNACRLRKQWIFVNNKWHVNWQNKTKYENKNTKETYQDYNHKSVWRWWLANVSQNDVQCLQRTFDDHNNIKEKKKRKKYWYLFLFTYYINNKNKKKKRKVETYDGDNQICFLDEWWTSWKQLLWWWAPKKNPYKIRFYNFHTKKEKNIEIN